MLFNLFTNSVTLPNSYYTKHYYLKNIDTSVVPMKGGVRATKGNTILAATDHRNQASVGRQITKSFRFCSTYSHELVSEASSLEEGFHVKNRSPW